jgi:hypothetical protein
MPTLLVMKQTAEDCIYLQVLRHQPAGISKLVITRHRCVPIRMGNPLLGVAEGPICRLPSHCRNSACKTPCCGVFDRT